MRREGPPALVARTAEGGTVPAAVGPPALFLGWMRPGTTAATVRWTVGRAYDVLDHGTATVRDLARCRAAGPAEPSYPARALLAVIGMGATGYDPDPGSADHVTAAGRIGIVARRDRLTP